MKKILLAAALTIISLSIATPSHALVSCGITVEDKNDRVLKKFSAGRGEKFGNRSVKKLHDCNTCWNGGKHLGPQADYCGKRGAHEYRVTCQKNNGKTKVEDWKCP